MPAAYFTACIRYQLPTPKLSNHYGMQTGDMTDRGPASAAVVALFSRLAREAEAAGSKLVTLLGNHCLMNLQVSGDCHNFNIAA